MGKFLSLTVVGLLVFGTVTSSSGQLLDPEPTETRVEKTFHNSTLWGDFCGGFDCVTVLFDNEVEVRTPSGAPTVDVVVSLTMDYVTTAGDGAAVTMHFRPEDDQQWTKMAPGQFSLRPSKRLTTTTVNWSKRNLEGGGKTYIFRIEPRPKPTSSKYAVSGKRMTFVADVLAAES